jgi:hypothetical protein
LAMKPYTIQGLCGTTPRLTIAIGLYG